VRATTTILLACVSIACGRKLPSVDDESSSTSTSGPNTDSTSTSDATSTTSTATGTSTSETTDDPTDDPTDSADFVDTFEDLFDVPYCDAFAQDCPQDEKCVPLASTPGGEWDDVTCIPVGGNKLAGEPCTASGNDDFVDDCDLTSVCWMLANVDGQVVGTCVPFCMGTAADPLCPGDSYCLDTLLNFCISPCDPILQDCGVGNACWWVDENFTCLPTTDNIPAGQPCSMINDCASGNSCVDGMLLPCNDPSCCTPFCDVNLGDAECIEVPGTSCVPFFEQGTAPDGYDHVGVCIVP
jgi:hypothetical protein